MFLNGVFLIAVLVGVVSPAMIYIPGIPVNPMSLYQLQIASNMLQERLNQYPHLPQSQAFNMYADVYRTNYFLQKVASDPGIAAYNNVVYGSNNGVGGNKNIVFGHNNNVIGNNNYVFS